MAMDAVPRISRAQALDVRSSMANLAATAPSSRRGQRIRRHVHRAGHGGRQDAAGDRARRRRRAWPGSRRSARPTASVLSSRRSMPARRSPTRSSRWAGKGSAAQPRGPRHRPVRRRSYAKEMGEEFSRERHRDVSRGGAEGRHHRHHRAHPRASRAADHRRGHGRSMKPGSVIVDMAASNGGNAQEVQADQVATTASWREDSRLHRPARPPPDPGLPAIRAEPRVQPLMKLVTPEKDGQAVLDMDDTVVRGMTVAQAGETLVAAAASSRSRRRPRPPRPEAPPGRGQARQEADEPATPVRADRRVGPAVRAVVGVDARRSSATSSSSCCPS